MITEEIKIGDNVIYNPPYVRWYSKRYEGVVLRVHKNGKVADCKLGFGRITCLIKDLVKDNSKPLKP